MTENPIIIIGAGRSGTNILRDTLTSLDGLETWPCDEINLIWRHGNLDKKDDIFTAADASPKAKNYIRSAFTKFQARSGAKTVVEKTCANSLRIPFIDAIFPEARYIYIVRDGRCVALSAAKRWTASIELAYLLKKLRFVPLADIPHHGLRFIKNRLSQRQSREKRQASWGPIFPEMQAWVKEKPLIDVCAKQWATCVEESDAAFTQMPDSKFCRITYEDLTLEPRETMSVLGEWLGRNIVAEIPQCALDRIDPKSANSWKSKRDHFTQASLDIMRPGLVRHGYMG